MQICLIVDSNKDHNQILVDFLQSENYQTLVAVNSMEMFEILTTEQVDFMILSKEINADKNTLHMIPEIKRMNNNIKILVVTALYFDRDDMNNRDVDSFFLKPFRLDSILNELKMEEPNDDPILPPEPPQGKAKRVKIDLNLFS